MSNAVRFGRLLALVAVAGVNVWILWTFHDQHWYPADEGNYAHVAERILQGDVLHRDIQDLHAGLINFVNAGAFAAFGLDLVSLRYPLVLIGVVQALLVWRLFAARSIILAAAAATAATSVGIIQFLNPTAHWYALFCTVSLMVWLTEVPRESRVRIVGAGVLIGVITLFRQLTGVWIGMAVLVVTFSERREYAHGSELLLSRAILISLTFVLSWYLVVTDGADPGGIVLFASAPAALLILALRSVRLTNRTTALISLQLGVGMLVACAPLLAYHVSHGSVAHWISDVVGASLALTQLPFFEQAWFGILPLLAFVEVTTSFDFVRIVNGLYWIAVALAAAMNGVLAVRAFSRGERDKLIVPIVASFYALVTLHLNGTIYLYYSVGLSLVALLWWTSHASISVRLAATTVALGICAVALQFHAAQSSLRRPIDALRGRRTVTAATATCAPLPRSHLRIEKAECEDYYRLVNAIQLAVPAGSTIFALPSDAELYFLADRRNPFGFYNTALGIRTATDVTEVLRVLREKPPSLITFRPDDKYNTPLSLRIMDDVRRSYERVDTIGGIELYRPRPDLRRNMS